METEFNLRAQVAASFSKLLNSHGYGFQYSVLKEAQRCADEGISSWLFEASEVPVTVHGEDTRIDFVLKRSSGHPFYLVAECKRANPAVSNWCFARAPYIHRRRPGGYEPVMLDRLTTYANKSHYKSYASKWGSAVNPANIALDVKSMETGDKHDSGRGSIEKAASQVMRGLNGIIEMFPQHPEIISNHPNSFLPVIFTTAKLWLSETDLSAAELATGKINVNADQLQGVPWLCYQYHLSPGIKHSFWAGNSPNDLSSLMDLDFIRTIPIVSSDGIAEFLQWSANLEIG